MQKSPDIRSQNCIFVSHCLLAQGIRAQGLAKYTPAAVKPLLQFCMDNDVNIMQMPCPESRCAAGGIEREPHGKGWYETNGLRETASSIAKDQSEYIKTLIDNGYNILAIIGMEFSPACAINYLNRGPVIYKDEGIYIEELKAELDNLNLPQQNFVGVNMRAHKKLRRDLDALSEKINFMPQAAAL